MLSEELRDSARQDANLAPYAADFELLEQQMTLCKSALARLRSRATGPATRQPLAEWLDSFIEQWRLRHPHVRFEQIGAALDGVWIGDTVAVGQILTILLDNAARASPDSVTLETSVPQRAADAFIQFDIRDKGPGIPPALRGSLGAMPVDSTQGGHGVGLYLAFSAASRLGGSIDLASASPRGTRAVLRLPNASANTRSAKTERGQAASAITEKKA
jgi:two-component system sensor histidine kinase RegB